MEVVHPRCAGLDVSKRDVKVCVRIQGRGSRPTRATVTTWGSTTRQILALRDMLVEEGVGLVVIESTGTYWKPFYYLLEDHLVLLSRIDQHNAAIQHLEQRIEQKINSLHAPETCSPASLG